MVKSNEFRSFLKVVFKTTEGRTLAGVPAFFIFSHAPLVLIFDSLLLMALLAADRLPRQWDRSSKKKILKINMRFKN